MQTLKIRSPGRLSTLLLASALLLPGCEASKLARTFGLSRDAPDEFTVTTRAPLSMPPEFGLRPPRPGAPRPQELAERNQAESILAPQLALNQPQGADSPGQAALLQQSGPAPAPDIRRQVDRDAQLADSNTGFVSRLLSFNSPQTNDTQVDPRREAERLRQNAALGQPATAGQTMIVKEKKSSWFAGLFSWL